MIRQNKREHLLQKPILSYLAQSLNHPYAVYANWSMLLSDSPSNITRFLRLPSSGINAQLVDPNVVGLFGYAAGQGVARKFNMLNLDLVALTRQKACLRNIFIGQVDNRNSPQRLFSTCVLLA
jgi:hypothetical protein